MIQAGQRCNTCGCDLAPEDGYPVNPGMPDEYVECFGCHVDSLETGEITQCEVCGAYFWPARLQVNPKTGEREVCPYCGRVWCR